MMHGVTCGMCDYCYCRICIVCLAPSHVLLTEPGIEVSEVDYKIGKVDRAQNKVSGKRKNKSF